MSTLQRTLWSFTGFSINYYLIVSVYQAFAPASFQTELMIAFLTFVTLLIVSVIQWDLSYLFGGMALLYAPLILLRSGMSFPSILAFLTSAMVCLGLAPCPEGQSSLFERWRLRVSSTLAGLTGGIDRLRITKRIRNLVGAGQGGEHLTDQHLQEFLEMERAVGLVQSFFNGTDPRLEQVLLGTIDQVKSLQHDHGRLLLRASQIQGFLGSVDRAGITREHQRLSEAASQNRDAVLTEQLQQAIALQAQRLTGIENMELCRQRLEVQRLQLVEAVKSVHEKLHALRFTDVKTLQASSNAIALSISQVRGELDDMEAGLVLAEQLTPRV